MSEASAKRKRGATGVTPRRGAWRRTWFGLQTALGLARRGWFIPHRHADQAVPPGQRRPYAAVETLFNGRRDAFAARLRGLAEWSDALRAIPVEPGEETVPGPRWGQDWFPRLDAAMAYDTVRRGKPARIVEIGSGHSTRFLLRALGDGGLESSITAIDPSPRATLEPAGGGRLRLLRRTLQQAGLDPFEALESGDLLMIDSSHVLMPGSDVDILFGQVLPGLPSGVLVHIHDIFLPDDYPLAWSWRGYNEQLGVLPMLLGGGWETLFASHYAASRMAEAVAASAVGDLPLSGGAFESGLWLRKLPVPPVASPPITRP